MRSAETLGPWLRGLRDWVAPTGVSGVALPAGPRVDVVDDWLRGGGPWHPKVVRATMLRRSRW